MAPPQKRQISLTAKKEPEKAPPSSSSNTSASIDDNSPEAAPRPKRRMTWAAPVPVFQEEQPDPVNKQPMILLESVKIDFAKTIQNCKQLVKEMERIQKHGNGTHDIVLTNDFVDKMKEVRESSGALTAMMTDTDSVNIQPTRKRIQLTIKNCRDLFTNDNFCVDSTPIELIGFKWHVKASTKKKGFLALHLLAAPPNDIKGNYRIEVDCRFSILNPLAVDKDLIKVAIGHIYTMEGNTGWGFAEMAKFEDLLDPSKTFLTPDGNIEIWADFTIKSTTLDHLT